LNNKEKITKNLESIAEKIRLNFSAKDTAREKALRLSREIIRHSANTIRAVHRREYDEAQRLLNSAASLLQELNHEITNRQNELLYAGFVHDAQKEFAEASITFSLINSESIPDPGKLNVSYPAYLNGIGEATGELRRYILDSLRQNDFSRCEELLSIMDEIYAMLVTMDFPDAITYGLRRTTDTVRGILEKTRGDLTIALRQKELEKKLESTTKRKQN
jgi:translin